MQLVSPMQPKGICAGKEGGKKDCRNEGEATHKYYHTQKRTIKYE